jgi:gamma-glutamyltranspeptidase/glutathione hydrolase
MKGMVVAPQPRAAEEGVLALRSGGNAVDAAVAAALVQGLVDPLNCGIGGLGWMHVYMTGTREDVIVDFCARAGSRATPDMWSDHIIGPSPDGVGYILQDDVNELGYQAIGIPGAVRGLHHALTRYGAGSWEDAVRPAIELARKGYVIPAELADDWRVKYAEGRPNALARFKRTEASAAAYTNGGGGLLEDGDVLKNEDMARSLEQIARDGPEAFYSGGIAGRLVADWEANGGLITEEDLAGFRVDSQSPLCGTYRGYAVSDTPPPSGGVTLIEVLNILEGYDLAAMGHNSAGYIRVVSQALKAGFADRAAYLGDPAFVDVPVDMLVSKVHAAEWRGRIDRGEQFHVGYDRSSSGGTTHVSVVDEAGNCVSLTHTNGLCSGVVTPGLGFLQNNYMLAFDPVPGGPNSIAPGKKRTTGALPCILFKDEEPFMVLGAPGGARIISAVLQTILNVVDHGMTALEAVSAPRIDCQGGSIYAEGRIPAYVCDELAGLGFSVQRDTASYGVYPSNAARVHAIVLDDARGGLSGGADPRGYGVALVV